MPVYVLITVLLLVLLILFVPIVIYIEYGEDALIKAGWLFFRFQIYPEKEKTEAQKARAVRRKERQQAKKAKKKPKTPKEEAAPKEEKKLPLSVWELIALGKAVLPDLFAAAGGLVRSIMVSHIRLRVDVAGTDAAAVAIACGRYYAYFYNAYAFFSHIITIKPPAISVMPNYLGKDSKTIFEGRIHIRPAAVLAMAFKVVIGTLKGLVSAKLRNNKPKPESISTTTT